MPTPTKKELAQAKADAEARDKDKAFDAMQMVADGVNTATTGELIRLVGEMMPPQEMARFVVKMMREGSGKQQEFYYRAFFELMRARERNTPEVTESVIQNMLDEQLDALLATEYGILERASNAENPGGGGSLQAALASVEGEVLGAVGEIAPPPVARTARGQGGESEGEVTTEAQ